MFKSIYKLWLEISEIDNKDVETKSSLINYPVNVDSSLIKNTYAGPQDVSKNPNDKIYTYPEWID